MSEQFHKGDRVRWASQSGGHESTKEGTVVGVVGPNECPRVGWVGNLKRRWAIDTSNYSLRLGGGLPRGRESYLVSVPGPDHPNAKPRLYWPRVDNLECVTTPTHDD